MDRVDAWDLVLKVAALGSFSEAARQAGISPGQVSKTISALEDRLGVRLFDRTTRAVRLTPEGDARLEAARTLLEAAETLSAGPTTGTLTGTVRISAPVIYGARVLAPKLNAFLADHPEVRIRLTLSDRQVDLVNDGIDLALRIGEPADTSLVGRRLGSVVLHLLAKPGLVGDPLDHPEQLAGHACIIDLNMATPRQWSFLRDGTRETVRVDGRMETDSVEVSLAATQVGLGIGLIPDFCLGATGASDLERLLPGWDTPEREVWLLWPSSRHLAPRTRAVVDHLALTL